ncbi:hypothetical protein JRQ81_009870 [Phrynocephalus forsythii]|uniref:Zinc finger and BTB domain-containing protein 48 n=1 Tax=Phrynocephalus forsythii TaxID=171643 RepID=A0A9Q0X9J3_9SAUR|nr:hypothetical protein JRQ81_009870 [Phrynocephalus forsythii]
MEGSFVQHSVRVLQELNKQRERGQYCDATLAVGSLVFKAHWSVLACCSSSFQSMYDGVSGEVMLPESFAEIFALLLDFFYTGHLAITPENWEKLHRAAEELRVPEAQEMQEALGASEAPAEADGGGKGKMEMDEDYVPGNKSLQDKKRPHLARKPASSKAVVGNGNLLEARALGNRRGTTEPVECPTCHKSFLSKYYLKVHNRKHTGEKPFECSKCGKCYFRKENLLEHEARNCMNRSEQVFTCSICQEVFKRRMELRLHMVTHTGEMPYKCSSCVQQFMQKKDLQSHLIKLHGAPKPHACSACSKCFLSRTELHLHEAFKHRGEKLFVCEECGHRASSRNGLQMHIKAKHRNERPYVCEFCQHAFTQKANLNMHLRTHTGEKPFQCHLCGKTFRTQASLEKHNRTHTGERPFSCEFCEQRFTERGPLLRHVASRHQEGRPHFCQICGKTFKAVEQLRVHIRRHKGVRKFECTECGYKFTRQAHLRRHMEIHDRVENYNPRQRKLRNLIIADEKAVAVALQPPDALEEVGSAEVMVESLASGSLSEELHEQRLGASQNFGSPDVVEQSLIITIPDDCDT